MTRPSFILALLALLFTVGSFFKPTWPLLQVAVLLLSVAMLVGSSKG
jgi:hypothetical protein